MSVTIQDNFNLAAAKAVDNRYAKLNGGGASIPYANLSEAYTAIPLAYRHVGLTVAIDNGSGGATEYWFKDNTTTLVSKGGGGTVNADNGLNFTSGYVKLGGALTQATTEVTGIDQNLNFKLNSSSTDKYTNVLLNKTSGSVESGSLPNLISATSGSVSKLATILSNGSLSTTNYTSDAYKAQTKWTNAHPWVTMDAAHNFEIFDNIARTNTTTSFIAHYYDERVGSPYWQQTWTSGFVNLIPGRTYTLRTKKSGDVFPTTLASSTVSGSIGNSGWVFVYSGNTAGAIWTNGSIIDGDFPVISYNQKSSTIIAQEDSYGKGQAVIRANSTLIGDANNSGQSSYSLVSGYSNTINSTGNYHAILGGGNLISGGNTCYAIGETNTITQSFSGAIGVNNQNLGYLCHSIGYGLNVPSRNTGTFQAGIFNDIDAIDYKDDFVGGTTPIPYPLFSIGGGTQEYTNPAYVLNAFHVMKNGLVKSYNGHDARSGTRGICFPQWVTTGWESTVSGPSYTFVADDKYIILIYVAGDNFGNVGEVIWGQINVSGVATRGTVFISNGNSPTNWTHGSRILKVGRPINPKPGEMGFSTTFNQLEYYNGTTWIQI